jgi:hypothetical protein
MKKILIIITLAVWLGSCTEKIDIELDSTYERLAVEGYVTTDTSTHWVRLSRSSDYYSGNPPQAVSNAIVRISDGTTTLNLEEDDANPGFYKTSPDFFGLPNRTYSLAIELAEEIGGFKNYSASCRLNPVAEIDSIRVQYNEDWEIYEVQIFALEPPTTDFYSFEVLKNGVLLTDTINKVWISDDRYFNGNYTLGALVGILDPENPRENPEPGDVITLKMNNITRDYYKFILELQDQTFQYRNPLFSGPPANVLTNIENAHGFFAAYSTTYSSTVFKGP